MECREMKMRRLRIFLAVGIGGVGAIAPIAMNQAVLADNVLTDYTPQAVLLARADLLAQNAELGCRRTNTSTGVYIQPNLDSASQGMLNSAQTIRLERKGEGWARINQPIVGWVQSRYLTPAVPCDPLNGTTTIQGSPQQQITALPPATPAPSPQQNLANTAPVKVTCDVLPANGLIVRSEPVVEERTYLTTLAPGTHEFQFTREAKVMPSEAGDRRWVYITAPSAGWITLGLEGGSSTLGGQECG
jgi:hypothetical protein